MRSKRLSTLVLGLLLAGLAASAGAAGQRLSSHRCTGSDSGSYHRVFVANGDNCSFTGSAHDLVVQAGGTLTLTGAHVLHDLIANGAASITIGSNTRIEHDASVSGTSGTANVSGSAIGHNGQFSGNHALVLSGDTIGHNVSLAGNSNAQLSTTKIGHDAFCAGTVTGSGNSYGHRNRGCP
jgi:hypothetical protein